MTILRNTLLITGALSMLAVCEANAGTAATPKLCLQTINADAIPDPNSLYATCLVMGTFSNGVMQNLGANGFLRTGFSSNDAQFCKYMIQETFAKRGYNVATPFGPAYVIACPTLVINVRDTTAPKIPAPVIPAPVIPQKAPVKPEPAHIPGTPWYGIP